MNLRRRDPWAEVFLKAESNNKYERISAYSLAVGFLDLALQAVGADTRHGALVEHLKSYMEKHPGFRYDPDSVRAAVQARNDAVHRHRIGDPGECLEQVSLLHLVWDNVRKRFVTREKAKALAATLLGSLHVHQVMLFGSLTRTEKPSGLEDIDLLVFDDGEISALSTGYGRWNAEAVLDNVPELKTSDNQAAIRSGWLDFVALDKALFETDENYRLTVAARQSDPLFFLNLAQNLQEYDPTNSNWVTSRSKVFMELADIRRQLEKLGFLDKQI